MRPKAFPQASPGGWTADYAKKSDDHLDADLARTLQRFRSLLYSVDSNPRRADVRETLRRLAEMTPGDAMTCWPELDESTAAEIERAQFVELRQFGETVHANLPFIARLALDTMEPSQGGRPPVAKLAAVFAASLAAHWWRIYNTAPTVRVTCFDPTPFQAWATDLLASAGFPTGDAYKFLRDGVRIAKQDNRIA